MRICFLADKHDLFDDRIYWKMAVPLVQRGFEVHYLLVGENNEKGISNEGVNYEILKIKTFSKNRYLNFFIKRINPDNNYKSMLIKASLIKADIYHFHDLWINRIGKKLKNLSHSPVVFYDAREPYAEDYKSYSKSKGVFKIGINLFAYFIDIWEKKCSKYYDLVISNEKVVRDNFRRVIGVSRAEVLFNYTDIYRDYENNSFENKKYDVIYCGGITEQRGVFKILESICLVKLTIPNIKVLIIGKFASKELRENLEKYISKNNLNLNLELKSQVNYSEISKYYNQSRIGIVTLFPIKTFKICMPIKVFEYMAFGLPIVGSDFGPIKKFVEADNCGILVNPLDVRMISEAIIKLLRNKKLYSLYSDNGRKATLEKYKWEFEFERLLEFYTIALKNRIAYNDEE
jgi:glycosyltransferase involved in cell wall biosynthesis